MANVHGSLQALAKGDPGATLDDVRADLEARRNAAA
jgi:hypothetical protein